MQDVLERMNALEERQQHLEQRLRRWRAAAVALGVLLVGGSLFGTLESPASAQSSIQSLPAKWKNRILELESEVTALQGVSDQLAALFLSANGVDGKPYLQRVGNNIYITGANLHIVNGMNDTRLSNGLGNLIIGYNEPRNNGGDNRAGSHNLSIGYANNFTSTGGLVTGAFNSVQGEGAAVIGGDSSRATGSRAVVVGGHSNVAEGASSLVGGGWNNQAIGGGFPYSAVVGGQGNIAGWGGASVFGGNDNRALGDRSTVTGGASRTVNGTYDWRAGELFQDQ